MTLEPRELDSFWAFVRERDLVWQRRAAGEPEPWTDDAIIASHHFTNVHRWKDPGTRWIVEKARWWSWVLQPDEIVYHLVGYRTLNRVQTFEDFGLPPTRLDELKRWVATLREARERGYGIGSPRHQTSLDRTVMSLRWMLENPPLRDKVAQAVWDAPDGVAAVGELTRVPGLGPFYAIQVVADLLTIAPDEDNPLAMGPDPVTSLAVGSRTAVKILRGEIDPTVLVPNDQSLWRRSLARLWRLDDEEREALVELHESQPDDLSSPLAYVDIEHSLCEWNRYHKLIIGDPRIGRRVTRSGALSGSRDG